MGLHHVISSDDWRRAQAGGAVAPASLAADGFVHLCDSEQVDGVLARHFPDRDDLILLTLDPGALPEVRREDLYGHGAFPHAYGPLPLSAVLDARPLRPCHAD